MKYSAHVALDGVYKLLAQMSAPPNPDDARLDDVLVIAEALIACGQDRSWASVWWAYAALHYEMTDEALERAAALLSRVDDPSDARAAALMLQAEIKMTQAVYASTEPSPTEQRSLLEEAVSLAPKWPSPRLRLARAAKSEGWEEGAREHAAAALALLREAGATSDPFDSAITGRNLDHAYVEGEVAALLAPGV